MCSAFGMNNGRPSCRECEVDEQVLAGHGQTVLEALVPFNSKLIGKTLKESDFGYQFGALVLAVRRHGETLYARLADIALRASDCLLVMTNAQRLSELRQSEDIQVVSELEISLNRERFWWLPLASVPAIVVFAVTGLLEILGGAVLGAILLLILGVLATHEAYRSVEWSVVFLIAAFRPGRRGDGENRDGGFHRLRDPVTGAESPGRVACFCGSFAGLPDHFTDDPDDLEQCRRHHSHTGGAQPLPRPSRSIRVHS